MVFIRYEYLLGTVPRTHGEQERKWKMTRGEMLQGATLRNGTGGTRTHVGGGRDPSADAPSPTQSPGHHRQRGAQDQDGHAVADDL